MDFITIVREKRIVREIAEAKDYYRNVEVRGTVGGGVTMLVALQPHEQLYTLEVSVPASVPVDDPGRVRPEAHHALVAPFVCGRPALLHDPVALESRPTQPEVRDQASLEVARQVRDLPE